MEFGLTVVISHEHLVEIREDHTIALFGDTLIRDLVKSSFFSILSDQSVEFLLFDSSFSTGRGSFHCGLRAFLARFAFLLARSKLRFSVREFSRAETVLCVLNDFLTIYNDSALRSTRICQVVSAEDHVLCRRRDRRAVFRSKDIVDRKHQISGLGLCLNGKRYMYSHLVTVEVGVESRTNERVKLDRVSFYQYRFECLDTESVKSRSTVEHDRMFFDDIVKHVPYFRSCGLDISLGLLDRFYDLSVPELFHDERLKQFERHYFRHAALIELEFRSYYDY